MLAIVLATLFAPSPVSAEGTRFVSEEGHFGIVVPEGWQTLVGVDFEGTKSDLLMVKLPGRSTYMGIVRRHFEAPVFPTFAGWVLSEELRRLQQAGSLSVVIPIQEREIQGHAAATVWVWQHPSADYDFRTMLGLILGPERSVYWFFVAVLAGPDMSLDGPILNATMESFEADTPGTGLALIAPWLFYGGLVATAGEGLGITYLIIKNRRPGAT